MIYHFLTLTINIETVPPFTKERNMATAIDTNDDELEALMAELEAQNQEIVEAVTARAADSAPVIAEPEPIPAPVAVAPVAVAPVAVPVAVAPAPVAVAPEQPVFTKEELTEEKVISRSTENAKPKGTVENPIKPESSTSTTPGGLQYHIDVTEFRNETRITNATLDECMIEQNGLRAFYSAAAARSEAQASRLKAKFDVIEATLYDQHRKTFLANGEKATEKMVENAVKADPRWLKGKNTLIDADTIASINKGLVESLRDRATMLVQLGADRRDEMKGGLRTMETLNDRNELRDRALRAAQGQLAK